jgi:hypothetical protein
LEGEGMADDLTGAKIDTNALRDDINSKKIDYSKPYDEFVTYEDIISKDILDLMGFTELTDKKRNELHEKIYSSIEVRVAEQILDRLSETERNEYDQLLIAEKDQEGYEFLKKRGIIPEEILTTEVIIMKLELYEDSKVVRENALKILEEEQKGNQQ